MATGDWRGARDAFSAVLAVAEVPEALFGLANALFWLGDLAGTIANCEKAYAGFRRRGDLMFAAGAALSLAGYNKGYLGNTAAARGWLSRAARIIDGDVPELRGELLGATAYVTDDPVESEALARQAVEIGRANGNSDLELMALHAEGGIRGAARIRLRDARRAQARAGTGRGRGRAAARCRGPRGSRRGGRLVAPCAGRAGAGGGCLAAAAGRDEPGSARCGRSDRV